MQKKRIVETQDPQLNAVLLVALISSALLQDYEFQEEGLHCFFKRSILHFQVMIKSFLEALYEITNRKFYFEIINDQEAILKIYGTEKEKLQFSSDVLFQPSISSQRRGKQ